MRTVPEAAAGRFVVSVPVVMDPVYACPFDPCWTVVPRAAVRSGSYARRVPFRSPRRSPGRSLVIGVVGIVLLAGIVVLVFPAALGVLGTAGSVVGSLLPWLALLLVPVAGVASAPGRSGSRWDPWP
ncbi:hypothetical protein IAE22_31065, partial [Bacillus sp. S34]|nr:hypothetical protein [Bacillus sp. S34]